MKDHQQVVVFAQQAIPLLDQIPEIEVRLIAQFLLGKELIFLERYKDALPLLLAALQLARECQQEEITVACLAFLGRASYEVEDYSEARLYYQEALAKYKVIGDERGERLMWAGLGVTYVELGQFEQSIPCHH